jgi:hypothetical protein
MNQHKLSHICLANAFRDEQNENYRFGKRAAQFDLMFSEWKSLGDQKPGIVSIKELRACFNSDKTNLFSAVEIASHFAQQGGYAVASCESVKLHGSEGVSTYRPFYLAQLYDSNRFEKIGAVMHRYYEEIHGSNTKSPPHGCAHLTCTYAPLVNGQPNLEKTFVVETMHFPVGSEAVKIKIAQLLNQKFAPASHGYPTIRVGDFNTFQDKVEHNELMNLLTSTMSSTSNVPLTDNDGTVMRGTFFPFPHDRLLPIDKPSEAGQNHSVVDHIFVHRVDVHHRMLDRRTYHDSSSLDQFDDSVIPLSDHRPLQISFSL